MPGKTYNAGTIFLQVVPVFGDVQRSIERQAKDASDALGDELERGGKEAGKRTAAALEKELTKGSKEAAERAAETAGGEFATTLKKSLVDMNKSLKPITPKWEDEDVRRGLDEIKKSLVEIDKIASEGKGLTPARYKKVREEFTQLQFLAESLESDLTDLQKHDFKQFTKNVSGLGKAFENVQKAAEIEIRLEPKMAERAMGAFEKKFRASAKKAADALGDSISSEVKKIRAELESLSDSELDIDISSAEASRKIEDLHKRLRELAMASPDIRVKVEAAAAAAELGSLHKLAKIIDGTNIDLRVDVDSGAAIGKLAALRAALSAATGDGNATANSFRSFRFVILAVAAAIPALIPMIGALGGALLALGPILASVGSGLGAMLIGFSGIGDAVTAMGDVSDSAAQDAENAADAIRGASYAVQDAKQALADAERNAAQAAADAARAVADAREAAADAIEDALDRQREAQEAYRDSVRDVQEAEQALRDARKAAAEEAEDLEDKLAQNSLDERQAVLDVFDATNAYNAVMADGSSTNYDREQAAIALSQARLDLEEIREEQERLREEKKKSDKDGVEGSEQVEQAQDALTQALEDQRDAQEAVGEAAEAVDEARIEGAEAVADALRNQARVQADGQRSVARAQEALRRAQEGYADALEQTGVEGSAAMQKLELAMGKLGPAGRKFAIFINSLRDDFGRLRNSIQEEMLPGVQRGLEGVIAAYGPQFESFMARIGRVVGNLFAAFGRSLQGPAWRGFFAILDQLGPRILRLFGRAMIKSLEAFARIMTIVAPWSLKMAEGMLAMADGAERWLASGDGIGIMSDFMAYAQEVGPRVINFLEALVGAALNIATALAPLGDVILKIATAFLEFVAGMDPDDLGLIVGAILGLVVAMQLATGAVALLAGGAAILASPLAAIVFTIVAIIAIVTILAIKFPKFREVVLKVVKAVGKAIVWLWQNVVKPYMNLVLDLFVLVWSTIWDIWTDVIWPTFQAIAKAATWLWKNILQPAFTGIWTVVKTVFNAIKVAWDTVLWPVLRALGKIIIWLWTKVFKIYLGFIKTYFKIMGVAIRLVWKTIIKPPLDSLIATIEFLWKNVAKPIFRFIRFAFRELGQGMKWVYDNIIKPLIDAFMEKMGGKEGLQKKFETVVGAIKTVWDTLKKILGTPIYIVLEYVLNRGLIAGFNKVADFVGADGLDDIPTDGIPHFARGGILGRRDGYASGGTLPGYTPGHDVHHFTSPSGGRLDLSGGEAIMRPEFTAAVGPAWVDHMNAAARAGGVSGIKRALGGGRAFAKGGVFFPVPGGYIERTAYNLGHDGVDINHVNDAGPNGQGGSVPFFSATTGHVTTTGYDRGYGNAVFVASPFGELVYGHAYDGSLRVRPGQPVLPGSMLGLIGNTGNSYGAHLHFGFPGGTFDRAMSVLQGADPGQPGLVAAGPSLSDFPAWLVKVAKDPLGYVKGLATSGLDMLSNIAGNFGKPWAGNFSESAPVRMIKEIPGRLYDGFKGKIWDLIPAPLKGLVGGVSTAIDTVGDVASGTVDTIGNVAGDLNPFARGGILPYNGAMKYDSGGYLPPGLTTVVNETGRPEPVFTADQFDKMSAKGGEAFHYEPHFYDANTTEDILHDVQFQIRKFKRSSGGKYGDTR